MPKRGTPEFAREMRKALRDPEYDDGYGLTKSDYASIAAVVAVAFVIGFVLGAGLLAHSFGRDCSGKGVIVLGDKTITCSIRGKT